MITLLSQFLIGLSLNLAWDRPQDPNVVNFRFYQGMASRTYTSASYTGNTTVFQVQNLSLNTTYYFTVTSVNSLGVESNYSNEVSYQTPNVRPTSLLLSSRGILTAKVYKNGYFDILSTGDLKSPWSVYRSFFSTQDDEQFGICMNESMKFFKLRDRTLDPLPVPQVEADVVKLAQTSQSISVSRKAQVAEVDLSSNWTPPLPPELEISFRQKMKLFFRYRPGRHPDYRKGSELLRGHR